MDPPQNLPTLPRSSSVDYRSLVARAPDGPLEAIIRFFKAELPSLWRDAYVATGDRPAELFLIQRGEFEFLFDDYLALEDRGVVPADPGAESRVVAVHGCSVSVRSRRDDPRLRGWVGATEATFGKEWDKGHFIANSIGGAGRFRCQGPRGVGVVHQPQSPELRHRIEVLFPKDAPMTPLATIPILRMFDEQAARDFYVGFLGFQVDWEHRFEPDLPLYMQVSLGACVLHLSGHHGDCCPGGAVRINVRGVEELQRSLLAKKYKFARPGLCATDWNSLEMSVTDPFGNRLTFAEYEGDGGASVGDAS